MIKRTRNYVDGWIFHEDMSTNVNDNVYQQQFVFLTYSGARSAAKKKRVSSSARVKWSLFV